MVVDFSQVTYEKLSFCEDFVEKNLTAKCAKFYARFAKKLDDEMIKSLNL